MAGNAFRDFLDYLDNPVQRGPGVSDPYAYDQRGPYRPGASGGDPQIYVQPARGGQGGRTGVGHSAPQSEREAYIRQAAAARGIDPDVAMRIARSEGFGRYVGDGGRSFGDWQLFTGGGLGNAFMKKTGLDPSDPRTWKQQTDFALDHAARTGSWAPWYGRGPAGVGVNEGFGGPRITGSVSPSVRMPDTPSAGGSRVTATNPIGDYAMPSGGSGGYGIGDYARGIAETGYATPVPEDGGGFTVVAPKRRGGFVELVAPQGGRGFEEVQRPPALRPTLQPNDNAFASYGDMTDWV